MKKQQKILAHFFRMTTWASDQFVVFGLLVFALFGLAYASLSVQDPSLGVDVAKLERERVAKRDALYVETPLRTAPFSMLRIKEPVFPDRECSIVDFGAVSDDENHLNTESFRRAIESCAQAGGGLVVVPKGIWWTGPIHLSSMINLHLEKGSRVIFSDNPKNYLPAVFSRFEGIELYNYSPFIYAKDVKDIAITGDGELDGNGKAWQDWNALQEPSLAKLVEAGDTNIPVRERNFAVPEDNLQPSFVQLVNCDGVLIEGIKILRSPSWTIHPVYSSNIIVRNIEVYTDARNTDGIALDSSRNVIVQDSLFRAGDDAIVIKSGKDRDGLRVGRSSENIIIHDVTVEDGHGGIAFGSEMSGGIRNVYAYNVNIVRADFGIRMKTMRGRGGVVENIFIEDVQVKKAVFDAIHMDMTYGTPLRKDDTSLSPIFRDISIENMKVDWAKSPYYLIGLPESPIRNLSFKDIRVSSIRNGKAENVSGEAYKDIEVRILGE